MRRLIVECKKCGRVLATFLAESAPVVAAGNAEVLAERHDLEMHPDEPFRGASVRELPPFESMVLTRLEQLEDATGVNGGGSG